MHRLTDPIGYDSIELREDMRESGLFLEGHMHLDMWRFQLVMNKKFEDAAIAADTYAQCSVCGAALGPKSIDSNHHSSVVPPFIHYCAEHCPACNRGTVPDDDEELELVSSFWLGMPGTAGDDEEDYDENEEELLRAMGFNISGAIDDLNDDYSEDDTEDGDEHDDYY